MKAAALIKDPYDDAASHTQRPSRRTTAGVATLDIGRFGVATLPSGHLDSIVGTYGYAHAYSGIYHRDLFTTSLCRQTTGAAASGPAYALADAMFTAMAGASTRAMLGPETICLTHLAGATPFANGVGWPQVFSKVSDLGMMLGFPAAVTSAARSAGVMLAASGVMLLPDLSDGSDGDISMFWNTASVEASLSFERDGRVSGFAYRTGDAKPWEYEAVALSHGYLQGLIRALSAS